ncbi:MAG: hypothetical protein JWM19_6762 [Actinomycetia bacterium]|nr:hypothetical protein [Actinomycetes bacterium]
MAAGRGVPTRTQYYALEMHIRGVIHIQVERLPPVIATLITSAMSVLLTWLATAGIH